MSSSVQAALDLIVATPGYEGVADDLARLDRAGRIRYAATLEDRAHAGQLGTITLGPEALATGPLSLAETLVHEHFHLKRQNPFHKTVSFWSGIATRTPIMARYERAAYWAALDFLHAVAQARPDLADEARQEAVAVEATFAACYGEGGL